MRRSVARWRTRPDAKGLGSAPREDGDDEDIELGFRRWDSDRRRRSSRSWARREGASSGRVSEEVVEGFCSWGSEERVEV